MPEIVWKAYIDFEAEEGDREKTRSLYERLLERTGHYKVYNSYAHMEASVLGGGEDEDGNEIEGEAGDLEMARSVYRRGYNDLRARGEKEDVSFHYLQLGADIVACGLAGRVEEVRDRARHGCGRRKGAGDDAANAQEVAQGGRRWSRSRGV